MIIKQIYIYKSNDKCMLRTSEMSYGSCGASVASLVAVVLNFIEIYHSVQS